LVARYVIIEFALQGALEPSAIETLVMAKERAVKEDRDIVTGLGKRGLKVRVKKTGHAGGYAFVIDTGPLGAVFRFKKNLGRENWNGFVKIGAESLAVHKRQKATNNALKTVSEIGFVITHISYNRVDYCIDILTDNLSINPDNFVAHSRTKKALYYRQETLNKGRTDNPIITRPIALIDNPLKPRDNPFKPHNSPLEALSVDDDETRNDALRKTAIMRGQSVESVTLGSMPGRQVIVYDKTAQIIAKRKFWWFNGWGLERAFFRANTALSVTRVEIRAAKKELGKYGIKSHKDLESHIGNVLQKIAKQIRYVSPTEVDTNISRQPLHPLWKWVQMHLKCELEDMTSNVEPETVFNAIRAQKKREYLDQIIGNSAGYSICDEIPIDRVIETLPNA